LVEHAAVVREGGRFACGQFVFAHKQMDVDVVTTRSRWQGMLIFEWSADD
jgi:hypothetical protein